MARKAATTISSIGNSFLSKMNKKIILITIAILSVTAIIIPNSIKCYAQEGQDTTRTQKGLKFNVPEDWPIEERNGVVGPIPIEEYIDIKFKDIASQLEALKQDWAKKIEEVNLELNNFKTDVSEKLKLPDSLMEPEKTEKDWSVILDEIMSRLGLVEKELDLLSEEMNAIKTQNDSVVKQYKDILASIDNLRSELEDMKYRSSDENAESWY